MRRDELVRADHASRKKHSSGEIERALKRKLPKLVTDDDLRGILHCHTDASDGTETLETMAKARRDRGFEYFGVADHSKSAHYAGGLSVEQIEHPEADRLNKKSGKDFRILKGIESDILADGSLYTHKGKFYFAGREVNVTTGTLQITGLFPNPEHTSRRPTTPSFLSR